MQFYCTSGMANLQQLSQIQELQVTSWFGTKATRKANSITPASVETEKLLTRFISKHRLPCSQLVNKSC